MDNEQLYQWLKFGDIKGETGITIVAAQDQESIQIALKTKFWRKKLAANAGYRNNMKELLTT